LVKELFGPTLQGEGAHAGAPCVFLRFAACNLACSWCDTDFAPEGAVKMSAENIGHRLLELDKNESRRVIVTGGEPALQWDETLLVTLRFHGFRIHMESNGTRPLKAPVDWLTVSPKPQFHTGSIELEKKLSPSECKVVVDETVSQETLDRMRALYPRCENWFLQPCDGAARETSLQRTLALVAKNPDWRLSLQLHKLLGLP
jgi:organic radical activating enzyme